MLEQRERPRPRCFSSERSVVSQRLRDLEPDRQHGIERGHRFLEDHRDRVAADLLHLRFVERHQVAPIKEHAAGGDAPVRLGHEAHDRERGDALAASGFADQRQGLVTGNRKTHVPNRVIPAPFDAKRGGEPVDRERKLSRLTHDEASDRRCREGHRPTC